MTAQAVIVTQSVVDVLYFLIIFVPAMIGMGIYLGIRGIERSWRDRRAGVIEAWSELRLTKTELIEGYKKTALRHPLIGLSAKVEVIQPSANQPVAQGSAERVAGSDEARAHVRLTIEGPHTAIVRSETMYSDTEGKARDFAAHIDLAGRSGSLEAA
ncbi:MAG: hypothetical protein JO082_03725 [Mycobacterium sp.]|nr:hypothetical protein [Mycobacterium sp.]MBV9721010.1 hypothetical protein [Mycobacterium sp.]